MLELAQRTGLRDLQCLHKVLANVSNTGGFTQPDAILEVEKEAAVVQIDGAHGGKTIINPLPRH